MKRFGSRPRPPRQVDVQLVPIRVDHQVHHTYGERPPAPRPVQVWLRLRGSDGQVLGHYELANHQRVYVSPPPVRMLELEVEW